MRNWSQVPHDVLEFIAKRIGKLEDFVRFGAVCKSWHAAAEKKNFKGMPLREHIPYLMLAAEGEEREFYSLPEHEIVAKLTLPCLKGKKCIESLGWLLIVGSEGDMSLLNPLTRVEIELPHQKTFPNVDRDSFISGDPFISVMKMVLSSRPDRSSDFVVMVLGGGYSLGFWRPGDHEWNSLDKCMRPYRDVTYFNGKFYAINGKGFIVVFDLAGPNPRKGRILTHLAKTINLHEGSSVLNEIDIDDMNLYIVEFLGALLVVARVTGWYDEVRREIFHLFKVDTTSGRWEEIYSLGSKAAFVGHSATTLVETSKFHEFKGNHIYYTLDGWHIIYLTIMRDPEISCKEIGVYNLENRDAEPFYHGDEDKLFSQISPAVWFTPSFI